MIQSPFRKNCAESQKTRGQAQKIKINGKTAIENRTFLFIRFLPLYHIPDNLQAGIAHFRAQKKRNADTTFRF